MVFSAGILANCTGFVKLPAPTEFEPGSALEFDREREAMSKYVALKAETTLFSFLQEEVVKCRSN